MDTWGIKKRRKKMKYYSQIINKKYRKSMGNNFLEGNCKYKFSELKHLSS